jgi:transcriptional regulator with XRE-family HTH domain
MPKRRSGTPHPLEVIRKGIGLSQADFARRIGITASMIKKIEGGTRDLPQEVMCRVFFETGVWIVPGSKNDPCSYTMEEYKAWKESLPYNEQIAKGLAHMLSNWIEVMLLSAARPGIDKGFQLVLALMQELHKIAHEFQMDKHIDAWLRDRHSTDTQAYKVRELRANDLLAQMVGFKDDPKYGDNDTLPMTKSTGWMPTKEIINIAWSHRALTQEILRNPGTPLTPEHKAALEDIAKQLDAESKRIVPD